MGFPWVKPMVKLLRNGGSGVLDLEAKSIRRSISLQWVESRWHNPQKVVYMDPYIKVILGFVPSTLNPL